MAVAIGLVLLLGAILASIAAPDSSIAARLTLEEQQAAQPRGSSPGRRSGTSQQYACAMEIVPASPDLWPAIADLFDRSSTLRWCWCQYWRKPGSSWTNTKPDQNRRDLLALVARASGPAPGLVALRDGTAVGWVGLGPREDFPRLARSRTIPQLPGDGVWVVNCFVVASTARRSGVASALLDAAIAYAREHGARTLEGYPVQTGGVRMASASAYTGTAGMFERAGFTVASATTSKAGGGLARIVARRDL